MNEKKLLNIDRFLGEGTSPKNRINKIGVELEGGWDHVPSGCQIEHDGSVRIPTTSPMDTFRTGEIPSPPKVPLAMWPWIKKYYPSRINNTCGMHVHMSFKTARWYAALMTEEFQNTMLEYLARWAKEEKLPDTHPIWDRLAGKNRYCSLKFWPDKQAAQRNKSHNMDREGHRYTAINYCYGKDNCGTVEVRVLPMFDTPEQAIRAVKRVLMITNACLVKLVRKEEKMEDNFLFSKDIGPYSDTSIEVIR